LVESDWVEGFLRSDFLSGLSGSLSGIELWLRERRAKEFLWRMTGSEMLARALWVLSRAAAAKEERMPLEERCGALDIELVDGELWCRTEWA
jgi:hypothetical protein